MRHIVPPTITMWLALVASLVTLIAQPIPAHAGNSDCVNPTTIGGDPAIWEEQTLPRLDPDKYFRYQGGATMTAPQSGQLSTRRWPTTYGGTLRELTYLGEGGTTTYAEYICDTNLLPQRSIPLPLFLPHTGGGPAPAQVPHR